MKKETIEMAKFNISEHQQKKLESFASDNFKFNSYAYRQSGVTGFTAYELDKAFNNHDGVDVISPERHHHNQPCGNGGAGVY